MNTQEYLWWIETIRQDEFRRLLPSNIIAWVALTICLISLLIFIISRSINSPDDAQLIAVAFVLCIISFLVGVSSLMLGEIISKQSRKQIEAVKELWKSNSNENKVLSVFNEVAWFYAESK